MATRDRASAWWPALALAIGLLTESTAAQPPYGIGQVATPVQVAAWNIDVAPDGLNLPAGQGSVQRGREIFAAQCVACHGAKGEGSSLGDKLVGGQGTLATPAPVRTIGSYWPYATTLFDYVRRAMPLNAPQSLSNEDVYAVSGYLLFLNGLLGETVIVNAKTLTELKMPNRNGFVADPRPDVHNAACVRDCLQ